MQELQQWRGGIYWSFHLEVCICNRGEREEGEVDGCEGEKMAGYGVTDKACWDDTAGKAIYIICPEFSEQ